MGLRRTIEQDNKVSIWNMINNERQPEEQYYLSFKGN